MKHNTHPNVWDIVINEMRTRSETGYTKYGKYLTKDTDEDMLRHLYEELLDASVYIRTLMEQRNRVTNIL
jgi:hypothetical protein